MKTMNERAELHRLEGIVERGLKNFREVGLALIEISERKLYRAAGFDSFEVYLLEKWCISRRHGYRMMEAAKVVSNLCPNGHIDIKESQARELVGLSAQTQQLAWQTATEAAAGKGRTQPTAAEVREAIEQVAVQFRRKIPKEDLQTIINRTDERLKEEDRAESRRVLLEEAARHVERGMHKLGAAASPHLEEEAARLLAEIRAEIR